MGPTGGGAATEGARHTTPHQHCNMGDASGSWKATGQRNGGGEHGGGPMLPDITQPKHTLALALSPLPLTADTQHTMGPETPFPATRHRTSSHPGSEAKWTSMLLAISAPPRQRGRGHPLPPCTPPLTLTATLQHLERGQACWRWQQAGLLFGEGGLHRKLLLPQWL